jgi:hypothetical protein
MHGRPGAFASASSAVPDAENQRADTTAVAPDEAGRRGRPSGPRRRLRSVPVEPRRWASAAPPRSDARRSITPGARRRRRFPAHRALVFTWHDRIEIEHGGRVRIDGEDFGVLRPHDGSIEDLRRR